MPSSKSKYFVCLVFHKVHALPRKAKFVEPQFDFKEDSKGQSPAGKGESTSKRVDDFSWLVKH